MRYQQKRESHLKVAYSVFGGHQKQGVDYYPFGLTMDGISYKASGAMENKKLYAGNELQNKEFSDGSGLELYDFNARTYDHQTGRFIQIDPMTDEGGQESWSPFHYCYNNPVTYSDKDGEFPFLIPFIVAAVEAIGAALTTEVVVAGTTAVAIGGATAYGANKLGGALANSSPGAITSTKGGSAAQQDLALERQLAEANSSAPKGSNNPNTSSAAKTGQEAHRQEQAEIKKQDPGAQVEKTMTLKDGTVVRKDAVKSDGTPVIIKPNTPSGKASAAKREALLEKNGVQKPEVKLYDPKDPKYQPSSPTYIGPKTN